MADSTLFFYDLETSGFNPREARIMQFGGQRTDMNLNPIGEPYNYLIRLSEDVLPDPDAILVTKITPQQTIKDGISEAEFLKIFHEEITLFGTIFVGYNTVRFDDEFMRYLHYRNFYDPYEWQWRDGRSRWDLLDPIRMMRALRPEGMKWPVDSSGKQTNRLELLTSLNDLEHTNAHDALNDVYGCLALARRFHSLQPKLFNFLLKARDKKAVSKIVMADEPFVYTSGKYSSEHEKTTVACLLAQNPKRSGVVLVYDLRYDPELLLDLSTQEIVEAWRRRKDEEGLRLPIKTLQFNRCPAVAPISVLDEASEKRIQLSAKEAKANFTKLLAIKEKLSKKVLEALEIMDQRQQTQLVAHEVEVDSQMYEGFFEDADKNLMSVVRAASIDELTSVEASFSDSRLNALLPLYKARNYPKAMNDEDRAEWERFRERKLLGNGTASRMSRFFGRIGEIETKDGITNEQRYLLQELQLYAQSIMPGEGS